ncbi:MAG: RNA pseudouridine synthase [Halobacteriovoraceae bacterium]|nr:RNA pseudouridine synthase [Halobacteriovoraceae bacterium]|tara:strand:- start:155 stop:796 length:642 start_codon:yes stop_codon:yes gene_type:complete
MFEVIYEHDQFIIINKANGYSFQGDEGVLAKLREMGEFYGVHRLDKETSGLMVFAKNKRAQSELSRCFENREVVKYYCALSSSRPVKKQGKIIGDLVKGRGGNYYLKKTKQHPSVTQFVSDYNNEHQLRVFLLRPLTGKTHQLRVVLKALGSVILGDKRYGGLESDRMYLHAWKLEFSFMENIYKFSAPPARGELFNDKIIEEIDQLYLTKTF